MSLTPKQLEILAAIRSYRSTNGFAPTLQEIADALGVSKVTVFEHVNALEKKGAIKRDKNKSRSIEVVGGQASREWDLREENKRLRAVLCRLLKWAGTDRTPEKENDELAAILTEAVGAVA